MECQNCKGRCIKKGKTKIGTQKFKCQSCESYQLESYTRNGCHKRTASQVKVLLKESCGIRSIARVLKISPTTVLKYIKREADKIEKPIVSIKKEYEADELKTYVAKKKNEQWIIYAIDKKTRRVVDFKVGRRSKRNIKTVIDTLVLSNAKKIYTDGLTTYRSLIPKEIHKVVPHNTNYIERKNLNLRTHLKRLTRRTICFSKSVIMLSAIMKIYFWG